MRSSEDFREKFGTFRSRTFYSGLITCNEESANVFMVDQLVNELKKEEKQNLFVDATFKVSPTYTSQLLIIFAEIKKMVI